MPFSKILVAYDGSKSSEDALDQAVMLVNEYKATQLEIIYVYQNQAIMSVGDVLYSPPFAKDEMYDYALTVLAKANLKTNLVSRCNTILKNGNPAKMILQHAEESEADLIVIGSRGNGSIVSLVLGSVSLNVVQHAKVPVLVVK